MPSSDLVDDVQRRKEISYNSGTDSLKEVIAEFRKQDLKTDT